MPDEIKYLDHEGLKQYNNEIKSKLDGKVDKVSGKGLSTNDYTTAEKNKLSGIETGANKTVVDSAFSTTSTNPVQNKVVSRLNSTLIPAGTSIPSDVDMNTLDYIKVGNYYCSTNASAKTLTNCPVEKAFMMQVYSPLSTTIDNESTSSWVYRLRRLTTLEGDIYQQFISSSSTAGTFTYGSWKKIIDVDDTVAKANTATTLTGLTATVAELNKLDGVTATTTELNYVDGVTSNIQSQLDGKQAAGNYASSSHSHSAATQSANGFMSSTDKTKLDGIAANANNYTHPSSGVTAGTYKSVTVNAQGHVTAGSNPTTLSGYGITDAVPTSRTVNGKALSANISLTASDVGAASSSHNHDSAYAAKSHTHNYAGSSSAGGAATSANKLNTNAGSATNPVYFANGVPVKTTYTLSKSVPSDAVFTDTVEVYVQSTEPTSSTAKIWIQV